MDGQQGACGERAISAVQSLATAASWRASKLSTRASTIMWISASN
jgi:hypothetical protein